MLNRTYLILEKKPVFLESRIEHDTLILTKKKYFDIRFCHLMLYLAAKQNSLNAEAISDKLQVKTAHILRIQIRKDLTDQ